MQRDSSMGGEYSQALTFRLEKQIVEIEGERNPMEIAKMIQVMRAGDSLALRTHIDQIEPGIDLNVKVQTPSGDIVDTVFTTGPEFFWPKLRV